MVHLHTENCKISNFYLKIMIISLLAITTGCFGLTKRWYEKSTGKKSSLKFKVLDFDSRQPIIYWIEGPNQTETALTLTPFSKLQYNCKAVCESKGRQTQYII